MTEYTECESCGGWCCAFIGKIECRYDSRVKIAKELGMTPGDVTQKFTVPTRWTREDESEDNTRRLKYTKPCIFWTTGKCGIHDIKPDACAIFEPKKECWTLERWLKGALVG